MAVPTFSPIEPTSVDLETPIGPGPFDLAEFTQRAKARLGDGAILSDVATQAVDMASRADVPIRELSRVIERDPGLGMQIIRIANSPLYAPSAPIEALELAIMMLGLRECQSVILASGISRMMRSVSLEEEWLRSSLCEHAVMCGVICRRLNQYFNLELHGSEFAAALLHDVGYIVIGAIRPEWLANADAINSVETPTVIRDEQSFWGTDHAEIGAAFAEAVGLPPRLTDVVRHHHDFRHGIDPKLTALVALGDRLANHLRHHADLSEYEFAEDDSLNFLGTSCGLRQEHIHPIQLTKSLGDVVSDARKLSSSMF